MLLALGSDEEIVLNYSCTPSCIYYCLLDLGYLDLHWENPSRNRILEGWDFGIKHHLE